MVLGSPAQGGIFGKEIPIGELPQQTQHIVEFSKAVAARGGGHARQPPGVQRRGTALLMLLPEEADFLRYLKEAKVPDPIWN